MTGWVFVVFAAFHTILGLTVFGVVAWLMLGEDDGPDAGGGGGGGGSRPPRPWRPRPPRTVRRGGPVRVASRSSRVGRPDRAVRTTRARG